MTTIAGPASLPPRCRAHALNPVTPNNAETRYTASRPRIPSAAEVTRLLSEQSVQQAATALGRSIRQQDGGTLAADLIEEWFTAASSGATINGRRADPSS